MKNITTIKASCCLQDRVEKGVINYGDIVRTAQELVDVAQQKPELMPLDHLRGVREGLVAATNEKPDVVRLGNHAIRCKTPSCTGARMSKSFEAWNAIRKTADGLVVTLDALILEREASLPAPV